MKEYHLVLPQTGGILVRTWLVTVAHGQNLAFFIGARSGKGSPSSTAAPSAPSAHSEVTHPLACGLAAWCKLALAKLEMHAGMLGFEYGEVFRVSEDIKISGKQGLELYCGINQSYQKMN